MAVPLLPREDRVRLYSAHALSKFGDRMWEFGVPILFMELYTETLLPSALFTLALYSASLLLMAPVGSWVDRTERLRVIRLSVYGQNAAATLLTVAMAVLLLVSGGEPSATMALSPGVVIVFCVMVVLAVVAELCAQASRLALERDWVVVLAQGDSNVLAELNAALRQIDLCCKLLAPLAFGLLAQLLDATLEPGAKVLASAGFIAAYNVCTCVPEFRLLAALHSAHPRLHGARAAALAAERGGAAKARPASVLGELGRGWRLYVAHPVFVASLSYCMLYMTVLDNGMLMTAWLKWAGLPEGVLGASRGAGALCGILGTLAFPYLRKAAGYSLERAGAISVWAFWLMVLPAAVAFAVAGGEYDGGGGAAEGNATIPPGSAQGGGVGVGGRRNLAAGYVMLVAVALSRVALWSFDLAHTQIMQEYSAEAERGVIGACQTALYQIFWVILGVLGVIWNEPGQFEILTYASVISVFLAASAFTAWAAWSGFRGPSKASRAPRPPVVLARARVVARRASSAVPQRRRRGTHTVGGARSLIVCACVLATGGVQATPSTGRF